MKKNITLLLILIYLIPQNLRAQNNDEAIAAGVGALVAIGAGIAAVEQMKEQVELEATQHILSSFPEYNRFLLKGDIVGDINSHLKSKSLIGDHVKHLPYEKSASMYVSKFICDEKVNYNLIKNS